MPETVEDPVPHRKRGLSRSTGDDLLEPILDIAWEVERSAAWAAVGKAPAVALAASAFGSRSSVATILVRQIHCAIVQHDPEVAAALLRDLADRNRAARQALLDKRGEEHPEEFGEEFLSPRE